MHPYPSTHPALIITGNAPDPRLTDLAIRTGWPTAEIERPRDAMLALRRYRTHAAVIEVAADPARTTRLIECLRLSASCPRLFAWNPWHTVNAEQQLRASGVSCYLAQAELGQVPALVGSLADAEPGVSHRQAGPINRAPPWATLPPAPARTDRPAKQTTQRDDDF